MLIFYYINIGLHFLTNDLLKLCYKTYFHQKNQR